MGIKTSGFTDLIDDLERLAEKAEGKGVDRALKAGAQPIFEDMKRQAAIDPKIRTGNLHKSIKIGKVGKTVRKTDSKTMKRITIGSHKKEMGAYAPHAHLVEFGHGGPAPAPPHPFVRPAFDKHVGEAFSEIRRVLSEEIR